MNPMLSFYPESRFGGYTDCDGTVCFYTRVRSLLTPSSVVLDVGCGRAAWQDDPVAVRRELRILKGRCARVIGLDVDEAARANPYLDEFRLLQGARWPVEDAGADLCLCDNVVEHIPEPEAFFAELRRALRPGGHVAIRTPNAWSYVGLATRLIPNRFHARLLKRVQQGRQERDVFPVYHRCNSIRKLRRMLSRHGFEHCVYGYEAEPQYLGFSRLCYFLGVLHQHHAPHLFKLTLFAFARKK